MRIEWVRVGETSIFAQIGGRIIGLIIIDCDAGCAVKWELKAGRGLGTKGVTRNVKLAKASLRRNWKARLDTPSKNDQGESGNDAGTQLNPRGERW